MPEKGVDVDAAEIPCLARHWKVTQVPGRGDFSHFWSGDQAALVLAAFAGRQVLSRIGEATAPQGTIENASSPPLVHLYSIFCRLRKAKANR
jgi:hypothetical protein